MSATTSTSLDRGATLDALELDAWRGFLRTHATLSRELDAELAHEHDLPLGSYEVLLLPGRQLRGARCGWPSWRTPSCSRRSGLTRMVDRMERQGLVRREPCPGDARGLNAVITAPGRERFAAARRTHLEGVRRRFLDRLTEGEKRDLAALWARLGAGTPRTPAPPAEPQDSGAASEVRSRRRTSRSARARRLTPSSSSSGSSREKDSRRLVRAGARRSPRRRA